MIIDCHAYCFPPLDSPAGYPTVQEHLPHVQHALGSHHQPVWRVRDGARADNGTLIEPESGAPQDVQWSRDELGRLVWTFEGETYTKQYLPPMLHNLEATPEVLLAEMDHAGVDMAVLHTDPALGLLNEYLGDIVRRFPTRLRGLASVWEADVPEHPDGAVRQLEDAVRNGLSALQFIPVYSYRDGRTEPWDDGDFRPFWEAVSALGIPVFFTMAPQPRAMNRDPVRSYLDEQAILLRWMERYPEVDVVMTHGLPWRMFLEGDRICFPEEIWEVFEAPRCHLQLLIPIRIGDIWEYPFEPANVTIQECVERIGANRLMWGTDMPILARFCTYRQALDHIRVHCDFLSDAERDAILGGTIAKVMGL